MRPSRADGSLEDYFSILLHRIGVLMGPKQLIDENGVMLVPPPKSVSNKEQLQRINYLLQLSTFHTLLNGQDTQNGLSRSYVKNIDLIQKKSKLSLTPALKRAICKRCHRIQLPLKTMRPFIENKSKAGRSNPRGDVLVYECKCGNTKRFPMGKDRSFSCYAEKESNLLEVQDGSKSGGKGH